MPRIYAHAWAREVVHDLWEDDPRATDFANKHFGITQEILIFFLRTDHDAWEHCKAVIKETGKLLNSGVETPIQVYTSLRTLQKLNLPAPGVRSRHKYPWFDLLEEHSVDPGRARTNAKRGTGFEKNQPDWGF
jgi:hypothetical protein